MSQRRLLLSSRRGVRDIGTRAKPVSEVPHANCTPAAENVQQRNIWHLILSAGTNVAEKKKGFYS